MESQPDCQTVKCPTKYQTQSKRNVTRSNHTIWGEAESITFQMYVTITANIWLHAIELILTQQSVMLTKRDRPIGELAASNQQCVDQSESSATTTPAIEGCVTCVTALLTTLCGKNSKVNIGPLL